MSEKKKLSGGAKLMASGKRPVLLGLDADAHEKIKAAAAIDGRPVSQFLTYHGLAAAEKILRKSSN